MTLFALEFRSQTLFFLQCFIAKGLSYLFYHLLVVFTSSCWRTFCQHLNVSLCLLFAKDSIVCPSDTVHHYPRPNTIYPRKKTVWFGCSFSYCLLVFLVSHTLPGRNKCTLILFLARLHIYYHNRWGCGSESKNYCVMIWTCRTRRPESYHLSRTDKGN